MAGVGEGFMLSVVVLIDNASSLALSAAASLVPRVIVAALILALGALLARWVGRAVGAALLETGRIEATALPALASAARYSVLILAFVAALSQLGVQTASLIAALGAAGLAIGLALQGTLANVAAGVMLLWLRPFRVGDYIEVVGGNPFAGTVKEIGLFACQLETYDGLFVFAPNSAIWTFPLRNHSRNAGRLISFNISLPSGADIAQARDALLAAIRAAPGVLERPPPEAFLAGLSEGGAIATCRLWAAPCEVGAVQRVMLEAAERALRAKGVGPTQLQRTVPADTDPSRLL
jgi:small conductance mechanosensitive channel